ncbi:hypothetical protein TNCV_400661 [Trichonephila clavipes]|nr:hypothetical protein TNCV_400661 [Trichonephila clavipes]
MFPVTQFKNPCDVMPRSEQCTTLGVLARVYLAVHVRWLRSSLLGGIQSFSAGVQLPFSEGLVARNPGSSSRSPISGGRLAIKENGACVVARRADLALSVWIRSPRGMQESEIGIVKLGIRRN